MPYYRCPECAHTVQSVAGRYTTRACPRCSVPLSSTDQICGPERSRATLSRRFPAIPRAAAAARCALETLLRGLDPAQLKVAALLTTELIDNGVEHSRTGAGASVRLDATLTDQLLRVEVGDEGPGFIPAPRSPGAPLDSQWGLHLVDQLADRWGVAVEPQTLVWFEMDRWRPPEGSPASRELASR